jgi:murein L,D-transpeptidase YcbB/YkuD
MRQIVDEIGEQFGWAKKWSDAPSEWWHLSYRPGVWDGHGRVHHHPTLHPGVKSDSVVTLRRKMKHHGYKGAWRAFPKSRSYNRSLVSAVKRYQKNHHLTPNGVVGPKTWRKLG